MDYLTPSSMSLGQYIEQLASRMAQVNDHRAKHRTAVAEALKKQAPAGSLWELHRLQAVLEAPTVDCGHWGMFEDPEVAVNTPKTPQELQLEALLSANRKLKEDLEGYQDLRRNQVETLNRTNDQLHLRLGSLMALDKQLKAATLFFEVVLKQLAALNDSNPGLSSRGRLIATLTGTTVLVFVKTANGKLGRKVYISPRSTDHELGQAYYYAAHEAPIV